MLAKHASFFREPGNVVTIKDIAKQLNISHTTVSLVLNGRAGKYRVSEEVARKVREKAEELGYVRNAIAHSMTTGCTNTIAFFIRACDMQSEYMLRIINGVLQTTNRYGFSLKLFEWESTSVETVIRWLKEQHVSGILLHHSREDRIIPYLKEFQSLGIPCCVANMRNSTGIGAGVTTDDAASMENAVNYLVSLGHERIAYLTHEARDNYLGERERGYRSGMRRIRTFEPCILRISSNGFGSNLEMLKKFLSRPARMRPTAVICESDYRAQELFQAAYQCRIAVPEALSIIGFGGLAPSIYSPVPLTTVSQSFEEIGLHSAELLLRHITEKTPIDGKNIVISNRLRIASSTQEINKK